MKFVFLLLSLISFNTYAKTLVLIGGGSRPISALQFFAKNVHSGPVLILPWGTSYPVESFESIKLEFSRIGVTNVQCLCSDEFSEIDRMTLKNAGGIYFPGGDQNKIMLKIFKYDLKDIILDLYESDIPIAGTSAGTAIQSDPMLIGRGSETSEGLGLLKGFIVDQHFVVRNRESRLLGALEKHSGYRGIGIDEDMSVVFKNGVFTALGPSEVIFYTKVNNEVKKTILLNEETIRIED